MRTYAHSTCKKIMHDVLLAVYPEQFTNMCPSDSEFIVVSAANPDPVNFWIQSLELYECDLQSLQPNQDLTESVICAAQNVLKRQFSLGGRMYEG